MSSLTQRRRFQIFQNSRPGLDLNLMGALDSRITFSRASSATFFDITGARQVAGVNVPRFDYDPVTHVLRGLLVEEGRTNNVLNSGAPATQTTAALGIGTYCLWMEGAGSVTSSAGTATATGLGAAVAGTPNVFQVTVAGTITLTVAGGPTLFQLENGPNATSYIPTVGAAVARAGDTPVVPMSVFGFNPLAGTTAVEFMVAATPRSLAQARIVGFNGNDVGMPDMVSTLNSPSALNVTDSGTNTVNTANTFAFNTIAKGAASWGPMGLRACLNAGPVAQTAAFSPANMQAATQINLMTSQNSRAVGSGWLRRVRVWNRQIIGGQLQGLTT